MVRISRILEQVGTQKRPNKTIETGTGGLWGVGSDNKISSGAKQVGPTYELIPQSVSILQLRSGDN